jgi:hypothetical protein
MVTVFTAYGYAIGQALKSRPREPVQSGWPRC